nr:hypothetical protein [Cnaphalocrocis medinalis granulovirus]
MMSVQKIYKDYCQFIHMATLKELFQETLKTQKDIAVLYNRVVGVENELKETLQTKGYTINNITNRLENLHDKLDNVLLKLNGVHDATTITTTTLPQPSDKFLKKELNTALPQLSDKSLKKELNIDDVVNCGGGGGGVCNNVTQQDDNDKISTVTSSVPEPTTILTCPVTKELITTEPTTTTEPITTTKPTNNTPVTTELTTPISTTPSINTTPNNTPTTLTTSDGKEKKKITKNII